MYLMKGDEKLDWISFGTGLMAATLAFALFSDPSDNDDELEEIPLEGDLLVNSFSVRHVTLSCQTCRKLKKHKEIEPNLYQCCKCKRHVDLRTI